MWSDIGNNLQIFEVFQDHIAEDAGLGFIVFEVMEELQKFAVFTIKTLSYMRKGNHRECDLLLSWTSLVDKF